MVGDGKNINSWDDKWIPRETTYKVLTAQRQADASMVVADFIEQNGRHWNEGKLRSHFIPEDVEAILSIPLGRGVVDRIVWHFSKNGRFSVNIISDWKGGYEDWMRVVVRSMDAKEFGWFLCVCWMLRNNRNAILMENKTTEVSQAGSPIKWKPPERRNEQDLCIGWMTKFVPGVTEPLHTEALATCRAVEFALACGWDSVVVEWDCSVVITPLDNEAMDLSIIGPVLVDIISLAKSFQHLQWSLVKRTANVLAHCIAQCAKYNQDFRSLPRNVNLAILADLN
ncbi:hypothetical protein Salat_2564400 [Sesamum alatum]|uniref:RNase H type-1 domain-containing protein n=1 Tax=Sesamum alatum TaxID=300844 RepID=A0AAE1XTQ3_9LAMI|nr:hypothetical protein Salat_2564400 [Sesamum alatum]